VFTNLTYLLRLLNDWSSRPPIDALLLHPTGGPDSIVRSHLESPISMKPLNFKILGTPMIAIAYKIAKYNRKY